MADPAFLSPSPKNPALSKAQATAKYNTLVLKANNFPADSSHQKKYLAIARTVLSTYPVTRNGGSAARLPPADDVKTTIMYLLPPPPVNFTAEYFNEALAPIILLHQIGTFYGFGEVNPFFTDGLKLTALEASSSSYGTQTWFAYIQELDEAETRVIQDHYKSARGCFNPQVAALVSAAATAVAQIGSPASMVQVPQQLAPIPAQADAGIGVSAPRTQHPLNPSWPALPGTLPGTSNSAP